MVLSLVSTGLLLLPGLPALGALASLVVRGQRQALTLGLIVAGLELLVAAGLCWRWLADGAATPLELSLPLLRFLRLHLGIDGLNALFVPLVALLGLLIVLYAELTPREAPELFIGVLFGYEAALMGEFLAMDALLYCACGVLELGLTALLAARWGTGSDRGRAMLRMVEVLGAGLLLTLVGVVTVAALQSHGALSFDLPDLLATPIPETWQGLVFFLLFYGFAIRMPIFPFHAWLPVIAQQGTVVVGGVLLMGVKVGAFGLLRWVLPLLPEATARYAPYLVALGVLGLLYGGILALVQLNLRRMLAFLTVSHNGAVLIGALCRNEAGLQGALLLMLSLGVAQSGLCFATGFIYRRTHTAQLPRLGGLFDPMPLLGLTFLVVSLTSIAMPGTSGFDAGHLLIEGSIGAWGYAVAVVAALGNVLAAATVLRAYQRAFLAAGERRPGVILADLRPREGIIAGILVAIIFGVGLAPRPWLGAVRAQVLALEQRLHPGEGGHVP